MKKEMKNEKVKCLLRAFYFFISNFLFLIPHLSTCLPIPYKTAPEITP